MTFLPQHKIKITPRQASQILAGNREDVMREMVRKTVGAESEFQTNIAVEWQNANKANALIDFEMDTGVNTLNADYVDFEDCFVARPDAWDGNGNGVTIKCPYALRAKECPIDFGDIKPEHYDYMQFSMYVAGCTQWHYYQWAMADSRYRIVTADMDWQDKNIPALKQFYAEYTDALECPDEYAAPARVDIDTPAASRAVAEWDTLCEQIDNLTERKKDLLNEMVAMAGDKNALLGGRKLTKVERAGSISYAKAIAELAPGADLEKWRGRASASWKFT